jgi:hypothetical protein
MVLCDSRNVWNLTDRYFDDQNQASWSECEKFNVKT